MTSVSGRKSSAASLAQAALKAAGHTRPATQDELALAQGWHSEGVTADALVRVVRLLRGRLTLDLLAHGADISRSVLARRKRRGAA